MLLNRTTLGLAKLASKDQSQYTLQAVCIEKDCAVETDGHQLVVVTHPTKPTPDTDYPVTPGFTPGFMPDGKPTLIARDAALAALKALPRKTNIPMLGHAALALDGEDGGARLFVNDLESVSQFKATVSGQFPNWRAIMPAADKEPKAEISFNAEKLAALLSWCAGAVKEQGGRKAVVKLAVFDSESAMRLTMTTPDGQDVTALLMPCRDGK